MSDWGAHQQTDAVITLADGEILPGRIHLQGAVGHRLGPETPLEMLNRPVGFFPVTFDDGDVVFLSKAQVAMVTCEWPLAPEEEALEAAARHAALLVVLTTGEEFRGDAAIQLPETRNRALDYVNSLDPFFLLRTASGPRLINRAHVRLIRPLD
jgi:hypothetical protein